MLGDAGAAAIVILENFAHVLAKIVGGTVIEHVIVTRMGDLLPFPKSVLANFMVRRIKRLVPPYQLAGAVNFVHALNAGRRLSLNKPSLQPQDTAFLQYTGGTTGLCKGAVLSHGNMIANTLQAAMWFGTVLEEGGESVITALPLYHILALTANCLLFVKIGGHNYLVTNPRDMPGFVKLLRGLNFTFITGVNTLYNGLLNTPGFERIDFSHLKLAIGGGMAVQAAADRQFEMREIDALEARRVEQAVVKRIHPCDESEIQSAQQFDEAWHIARICHQIVVPTDLHKQQAVGRKREDVIKRQCGDHRFTALPLYHIFALTANCLLFVKIGGHNYLVTNPRDMPGFVKLLRGLNFTFITGVNTLYNGLLNTPGFERIDFSHLKLAIGGGMAVQAAADRQFEMREIDALEARRV